MADPADPLTKLRRIPTQQAKSNTVRDRLIAEARDAGYTGQQIADVLGLTRSRVYQIAHAEQARTD